MTLSFYKGWDLWEALDATLDTMVKSGAISVPMYSKLVESFDHAVQTTIDETDSPTMVQLKGDLDFYQFVQRTWTFFGRRIFIKTDTDMKMYSDVKIIARESSPTTIKKNLKRKRN